MRSLLRWESIAWFYIGMAVRGGGDGWFLLGAAGAAVLSLSFDER